MSINQDNHHNAPMLPTDLTLASMSGVKPDENLSSATAVSSEEDAVLPPVVPNCGLEESGNDQNQCSRIQQSYSYPQLPQLETVQTVPVLLLDTHHSGSQVEFPSGESCNSQFKFYFQKPDLLESYHQAVKEFMSDAKSQKAFEALIVHQIDVTANCMQPVLRGQIVTEDELYKPLYSRESSEPIKIRVVYLLCPTECAEVFSGSVGQPVGKPVSCDDELTAPNCPSLCNAEFHSLKFDGQPNWQWQDVQQAFDSLEKPVATDKLADRIANCCGCSQRRMSGVPSAKLAEVAASVENTEAPSIPMVPDDQGNPLEQLDALNSKPSYEWAEPNAFVSVIIGKYEKDSTEKDRAGFKMDKKNFDEIAEQLGCLSENVRCLCPDDGYVSAEKALQFVDNYAQEWRNKLMVPRCLFVAVSAHGVEAGIRTSDGKIVSIEELMKKVKDLAGFVLLFYQACRGPQFHAAQAGQNHRPASAGCLGFVSPPEAAGCTLPPEMAAAAAIFASMAGYEAYRNEHKGSWMPRALLNVVSRRGRVTVKQLAEMLQAELHQLLKLGIVPLRQKGKSYTAYVQTQYSANQGFENFIIETGLGGGGRGTTAAREELAQLELNNPECTGQPD